MPGIMEDLRITRIDVYQVDLPYSGGVYRLSNGRTCKSAYTEQSAET